MKVRLNLATKPLQNQRRFVVTYGAAAAAALVMLALLSVHVIRERRADSLIRGQISQTQADIQSLMQQQEALRTFFSQPAQREQIERAAFLNSLIQQRSFPWTEIFQDLELTMPTGVRLVSIAPQLRNGHLEVKLVIGAQSDDSKLEFLKALEKSKTFSAVEVRQETHPKEQQGSASDRVLMELEATYSTT
jgi:hypothetical protein